MIITVILERVTPRKWEVTFSSPKAGGALKVSRSLKTAMKQLGKVLIREFPDPKDDPVSDLLIPPDLEVQ